MGAPALDGERSADVFPKVFFNPRAVTASPSSVFPRRCDRHAIDGFAPLPTGIGAFLSW